MHKADVAAYMDFCRHAQNISAAAASALCAVPVPQQLYARKSACSD